MTLWKIVLNLENWTVYRINPSYLPEWPQAMKEMKHPYLEDVPETIKYLAYWSLNIIINHSMMTLTEPWISFHWLRSRFLHWRFIKPKIFFMPVTCKFFIGRWGVPWFAPLNSPNRLTFWLKLFQFLSLFLNFILCFGELIVSLWIASS